VYGERLSVQCRVLYDTCMTLRTSLMNGENRGLELTEREGGLAPRVDGNQQVLDKWE